MGKDAYLNDFCKRRKISLGSHAADSAYLACKPALPTLPVSLARLLCLPAYLSYLAYQPILPTQPTSPTLPTTKKPVPEQALRSSRDFCSCLKEGGCLLSRIALQYHRRKRA